jgi:hypothetical protein
MPIPGADLTCKEFFEPSGREGARKVRIDALRVCSGLQICRYFTVLLLNF